MSRQVVIKQLRKVLERDKRRSVDPRDLPLILPAAVDQEKVPPRPLSSVEAGLELAWRDFPLGIEAIPDRNAVFIKLGRGLGHWKGIVRPEAGP